MALLSSDVRPRRTGMALGGKENGYPGLSLAGFGAVIGISHELEIGWQTMILLLR